MECLLEDLIKHIWDNMPRLKVVDEDYGQLEALGQESTDQYPLSCYQSVKDKNFESNSQHNY